MRERSYVRWLQAFVCLVTIVVFSARSDAQQRYWIEFRDKGSVAFEHDSAARLEALSRLSPAAVYRRLNEGKPAVTEEDAAIFQPYLDSLRDRGIQTIHESRWSNAVSARLSQEQITELQTMPFVRDIRMVATGRPTAAAVTESIVCGYDPILGSEGQSSVQLSRINVQPLMAMGIDATGVRLGFLDTGFRWRVMSSLERTNVDREYDYVFHDSVTANQDADIPDQDNHGSSTLSTAVGYDPGTHVGAAHNATLFLAKTEDLRSETPAEEDNWAQAIEDMERWGADVTSTSLGYMFYDSGWTSHTYQDLNGHTTISARAATRAGNLGVIVVNAVGNNGGQSYPYLNTPADADSILTAGGLDEIGNRAAFSSLGPTADGRIKPDISSPGVGVFAQTVDGSYGLFGGTSYATPLVASACCLIREAHPNASAEAIRNAVRATGSNAATPDDSVGWGEINAYAAALEVGDVMHQIDTSYSNVLSLCVGLASKYGVAQASVEYSTRTGGWLTKPLVLVTDSLIYSAQLVVDSNTTIKYRYALLNGHGETTYLPDTGYYEFTTGKEQDLVIEAYPNPTGKSATLLSNQTGNWQLYDEAGRIVNSGAVVVPGDQTLSLENLSDGAYFLVMRAHSGEIATQKLFVLH